MRKITKVVIIIGLIFVSLCIIGALVPPKKPAVPEKPAAFKVSDLKFHPSEVATGKSVQISVIVKNIGDLEGTYTVALKIDSKIKATEEVALAGGTSQSVFFKFTPEKAGTYNVEVDGLTGKFNVVLQIEAYDLYREYKENEIAADAKYKNQILYVVGEVESIGREILGRPYIVLAGDTLFGVQCIFDKKHEPRIAELTKGQWVTVRGRCKGEAIWNILLDDCSLIVFPEEEEEPEKPEETEEEDVLSSAWATTIPVIDGSLTSFVGEWDDSYHTTITLFGDGRTIMITPVDVYIKNDQDNLYLAFKIPDITQSVVPGSGDILYLYFDQGIGGGEHDGTLTAGNEDKKWWAGSQAFQDFFFNGDEWQLDEFYGGSQDGNVFGGYHTDHWEIEWMIPMASGDELDLNVEAGTTIGILIQYGEYDTGLNYGWPMYASYKDASRWATLYLRYI